MRRDEQFEKLCKLSDEELLKLAEKYGIKFRWDNWFEPRPVLIDCLNDASIKSEDLKQES